LRERERERERERTERHPGDSTGKIMVWKKKIVSATTA
jgi:hypothetical protein